MTWLFYIIPNNSGSYSIYFGMILFSLVVPDRSDSEV